MFFAVRRTAVLAFLFAALLGAGFLTPALADQADPAAKAYLAFFPEVQTSGEVELELHPSPPAVGKAVVAGFGMPFPPGFVSDANNIALFDDDDREVPIHVTVLATWPKPVPGSGSIRSALVQFRTMLSSGDSRTFKLRWGAPRGQSEPKGWPATKDWVPCRDGSYPQSIMDPPVYVTMSPDWLGQCLLKGRILPKESSKRLSWYDRSMDYFARSSMNESAPGTKAAKFPVKYLTEFEPWLYDRAATFFVIYFRLGKVKHLREAQRAAQFYASKLDSHGKFTLLPSNHGEDLRYVNNEGMAMAYWLFGDQAMLEGIGKASKVLDSWNENYRPHGGHWTERHLGIKLLGLTTAYEATDDKDMLKKARKVVDAACKLQFDPPSGVPRGWGCLAHRGKQHGENLEAWVCSPWMSGLYVDAAMRYYIVTADPRVPRSVVALADFIAQKSLFESQQTPNKRWWAAAYLVALDDPSKNRQDMWNDFQHGLDVSNILCLASFLQTREGKGSDHYSDQIDKLLKGFHKAIWFSLESWSMKDGKTTEPIGPPRKLHWWFRTTPGIDWYMNP